MDITILQDAMAVTSAHEPHLTRVIIDIRLNSDGVAYAIQNFLDNNLYTEFNDIVSQWTYSLRHVINSNCPRIKKRVKRDKQSGWINHDIMLMHMRDLAPSAENNIIITNILETVLQLS